MIPAVALRVAWAAAAVAGILLLVVSGAWYWVGWPVFIGGCVALSWFVLTRLLRTSFGFEKTHQASLYLLWWIPVALVVVGAVVRAGPWGGLPGQILASFAGSTEAWVWVVAKLAIVAFGGTSLWFRTVSKGSRL